MNLDDQYLVIDLSGGANASEYPVNLTNNAPDPTNVKCRTTELWLRHITSPKPDNDNAQYEEEPEFDFYIGVFPCTQRQYELVMGGNPSWFQAKNKAKILNKHKELNRDCSLIGGANWPFVNGDCPVEEVSYDDLRGTGKGSKWPKSSEVDDDSFFGRLRARTGLRFDLPTGKEWMYASQYDKDGYVTDYGWFDDTPSGGATHPVGEMEKNIWELYDIWGNVWEWCHDWNNGNVAPERVVCGGSWEFQSFIARDNPQFPLQPSEHQLFMEGDLGFRVALHKIFLDVLFNHRSIN